jgi:hypothetical protein
MRFRLLTCRLVVTLPVVALPFCLPWLVLASPLITMPMPFLAPATTS